MVGRGPVAAAASATAKEWQIFKWVMRTAALVVVVVAVASQRSRLLRRSLPVRVYVRTWRRMRGGV